MSKQARLDVAINIFELGEQHAQVLPSTTPADLIESILQEFREVDYLGMVPSAYWIQSVNDQIRLERDTPLQHQINLNQPIKLVLIEDKPMIPPKAHKIKHRVYIRESSREQVYKLHWVPALIGRLTSDPKATDNDLLAIDLSSHDNGLRVSRRHARITEQHNGLYLENLGSNPTTLITKNDEITLEQHKPMLLHHGDVINLNRSGIVLKVIIRDEQTPNV